ncbi:MAG: hypothetical protein K0R59_1051 [Sphingobacterium sp.]|jgi:hypothetical protein|nr:hypothetical protein [Sphingobacterium sp.]
MNPHNRNRISYGFKIGMAAILFLPIWTKLSAQQPDKTFKLNTYIGVVHPVVSYSAGAFNTNFKDSYIVGMPTGINVIKSGHLGFSLEMVPYIKVESGISKMNNFLFHPGVLFPLGKEFTFIARAAFETSGRYGVTPVISKVITHGQAGRLFLAIPLPVRFGNEHSASVSAAFQFGYIF